MSTVTKNKLGKRQKSKKAIKGSVKWTKKLPGKVIKFAKSQISERKERKLRLDRMFQFVCFGLLFQPTPSLAFGFSSFGSWGDFAQNGTVIEGTYGLTKELLANGVKSIPDPTVRTAVSSVGSIAALAGGTACGIGTAICTGMGWEQKAIVCFYGNAMCTGSGTSISQADPANLVTIPGRVAGEVFEITTEKMSA